MALLLATFAVLAISAASCPTGTRSDLEVDANNGNVQTSAATGTWLEAAAYIECVLCVCLASLRARRIVLFVDR
jgi:hypothetical protein